MILLPTEKVVGILLAEGFTRDDSVQYGCVGYKWDGEWMVIDESYATQDIDHLIQDSVVAEHYKLADKLSTMRDDIIKTHNLGK
ncbi:MAG: hypothetical protein WC794_06495 [Candidatus Doudnabacteria bacterium]|jgi:hypothetical protein